MKKFSALIFFAFLLLPQAFISAQTNAGFVPANIWYSKDPFEEGDKIQIYTLVFNPDIRELSGNVSFFDKNTLLGKKSITVPPKGVKDISINWTVTAGDHTIFAKLENARFLVSTGKYEDVYLAENQTDSSERTVSKKVVPKKTIEESAPSDGAITEKIDQTLGSIEQTIAASTPKVLSVPILGTANALESARESMSSGIESKKEAVKGNIETLKKQESSKETKEGSKPSAVIKPLKYAELFLFTLLAFIFGHKIIFYGVLLVIFFYLLRYIYRLVL
jgi:hypothetical protein